MAHIQVMFHLHIRPDLDVQYSVSPVSKEIWAGRNGALLMSGEICSLNDRRTELWDLLQSVLAPQYRSVILGAMVAASLKQQVGKHDRDETFKTSSNGKIGCGTDERMGKITS